MGIRNIVRNVCRGLLAPGMAILLWAGPASAATELPETPDAMVDTIRSAIESKDYDALRELVFWKDVGKIKKRIVRFHLNRNLGRKIKTITWEDFPEDGLAAHIATGKLAPNMEMTNRVRVVFDEPVIEATGKPPTAVFLVGKRKGAWRIGLVNRSGFDDDDD
ncbi:MAG: hypothetical protein AAF479_03330 [Pseudomonadota bacterium]